MDSLFSIKSLLTVSIASIVSIKTMHINLKVSRDINVDGTGNTVIVNEALRPVQKGFTLAERVLAVIVALSYPILGSQYNSVLELLAFVVPALAALAFITTVKGYGLGRFWDIFYVVGSAFVSWLVLCSFPFLTDVAQRTATIYPTIRLLIQQGLPLPLSLERLQALTNVLFPMVTYCFAAFGFGLLVLSLLRFLYANVTERDLNQSLAFLFEGIVMAIVAYFIACNSIAALTVFHNFEYVKNVFLAALPF
ncbi:hypothetical protein BLA14095_02220 [Burkholderia lata]|uniref:hypothetical protein n=1 Tax=Burkholderia lata (strain ATCC 17760 / DSM 23089 / LMG 22485 / NCIMB 9086 / R18194 / 383) TaxID=482957 RepID=UPI0014543E92|nr:hypothetical protein [Burkholderia lata]VWB51276.1 hypothetical protein BLA14095_02220 [Burkholderia lata]